MPPSNSTKPGLFGSFKNSGGWAAGRADFLTQLDADPRRVRDPRPWQVSLLSNGGRPADSTRANDLSRIWRIGSKEARLYAGVYLGILWACAIVVAGPLGTNGRLLAWALGALAIVALITAVVLGLQWGKLSGVSMYSALSLPPRTLGRTNDPFKKTELADEQALVERAIERGQLVVAETHKGWNSRAWELADGSRVKWKGPHANKHTVSPARVEIITPRERGPETHIRFKGLMLEAISEARGESSEDAASAPVARLAGDEPRA